MAWYGQKNYADRMGGGNGGRPAAYSIAEIGCFLTSFSNLLQKFGNSIDPSSLNKIFTQRNIYLNDPDNGVKELLGWASVTAYDGDIHASNINYNAGGGWPSTNNAIVKFAFTSRVTGQPTTHFCLVADPKAHTIIDSWDGVIRSPGYYGQPVAWAEYEDITPEPTPPQPGPTTTPSSSDSVYVMQKGDTIWGIAMKFGFTADELMAHNAISASQVRNLPVGFQVHLPVKQAPAPAATGITYEALPQPRPMHISKAGGAEKWAFGNVRHWKDFVSQGHIAENTNITIYGIARVLVDGDVAAYYMDQLAWGDCSTTGIPANTLGYNHADMADGEYIPPKPAEAPAPAPVEVPAPAPEPAVVSDIKPIDPNAWQQTYKEYPKPEIYVANATMMIHYFDGKHPDKRMVNNQGVVLSGTFIVDGKEYGRPKGAAEVGLWPGIPMDKLLSEDELYNTRVDLQTKRAMQFPLSNLEKITVVKELIASALIRAKAAIAKIKK